MENKDEATLNSIELLNNAIKYGLNKEIGMEQLTELFQLKKDYEIKKAKKSFLVAKTKFQFECKPILKLNHGALLSNKYGNKTSVYKYAGLDDIAVSIKNNLLNNGLSYRFDQLPNKDNLIINCIVSHIDGYSESTTVAVPLTDISNKLMNSVQNNISIQTYAKKRVLENALGLIIAGEDIDGRLEKQNNICLTAQQKLNIIKLLKETNTPEKDLQAFNVTSVNSMVNSDYDLIYKELNGRYLSQKKLLENNNRKTNND